ESDVDSDFGSGSEPGHDRELELVAVRQAGVVVDEKGLVEARLRVVAERQLVVEADLDGHAALYPRLKAERQRRQARAEIHGGRRAGERVNVQVDLGEEALVSEVGDVVREADVRDRDGAGGRGGPALQMAEDVGGLGSEVLQQDGLDLRVA